MGGDGPVSEQTAMLFRGALTRRGSDKTVYCNATTAAEARRKVQSHHLARGSKIVATTAIAPLVRHDEGVWTVDPR
jgi:hypothetical protein